ncbi:amino acid ABC transporter ATP-binding/permease protein [Mesorhizobium sp. CAU 1741]|uniref:amino acid ABC transporter ATP-binding/permease protein n=1 Tax=Mesorhizobium sp. CAU 1741 TaxID=3140366 RepID=UPI00325ACDA1
MTSLRHLGPILKLFWNGDRRVLGYGAALSLTTALAGIALLGLSGWFITATGIAGATLATALAFDVFMPSAGIRLLALGRTASRYGERLTTHEATLRVLARLRERIFRGWALPQATHRLAVQPSRLLFRLTLDIDALDTLYLRVLVPLLAAAGSALVIAVALAFVDIWLALAVGATLLSTGFVLPLVVARRSTASARRRAHALEVLRGRGINLVRGQADLAMTNRLGAQVRAIEEADVQLAAADIELNRAEANVSVGFGIVGAALLAGVVLAVARLAESGQIGAPAATFAVLLTLAGLEPFAALRRGAVEFGRTLLAAQRLGPSLAATPCRHRENFLHTSGTAVNVARVELRFAGTASSAVTGLSFHVADGERVALVGPSGAGKSTLLGLIAGELAPTSGSVAARPSTLMTQRTELFGDTLAGNLALARPEATEPEMLDALASAGLGEFITDLPGGLGTMLGEGGAGLSSGQARRLALARLFLRNAHIWLLDEPTEGLDGATALDVLHRTMERALGKTVLVATHCRREASIADRILVLREGRIVEDAPRHSIAFDRILSELRPD